MILMRHLQWDKFPISLDISSPLNKGHKNIIVQQIDIYRVHDFPFCLIPLHLKKYVTGLSWKKLIHKDKKDLSSFRSEI